MISGGGVHGSSVNYGLLATLGQASPVGRSSSTGYINYAGFWTMEGATPSDGLWVIDAENNGDNGRGFQLELRNNVMVLTYYGYNAGGKAQWYLAAGNFANGSFSAAMWRYEGGTYLGGPYRAASPIESVGTVSITFSSSTKGTITLPHEQPKSISKFLW